MKVEKSIALLFVIYFMIAFYGASIERDNLQAELLNKITIIDGLNTELDRVEANYIVLKEAHCVFKKEKAEIEMFWNAISFIESPKNGANTIGDCDHKQGPSYGSYQISKGAVDDVNRNYGTIYKHTDMFVDSISITAATLYANLLTKYYFKKYGVLPSPSQIARLWNGGYRGTQNFKTIAYVNKFNKQYKNT
jgi:hypothetical protein